jgi:hypothetical protein
MTNSRVIDSTTLKPWGRSKHHQHMGRNLYEGRQKKGDKVPLTAAIKKQLRQLLKQTSRVRNLLGTQIVKSGEGR